MSVFTRGRMRPRRRRSRCSGIAHTQTVAADPTMNQGTSPAIRPPTSPARSPTASPLTNRASSPKTSPTVSPTGSPTANPTVRRRVPGVMVRRASCHQAKSRVSVRSRWSGPVEAVGEEAEPPFDLDGVVAFTGPERDGGISAGRSGFDDRGDQLVEQVGAQRGGVGEACGVE